ncbi:MAG: hypothetical protein M3R27_13250, partial [Bacteroidota bacterium]|nr:hypothetical protein [Bacteroidota bacterium]
MKKILTSLLILFSFLVQNLNAQTTHPFELGFNAGASWLKSDVKMKKLGAGWGITFGQMYGQNKTNAIDWGWRFRYLNALAYGQDTKRSNGIANNVVLNGSVDTSLNYINKGGFVYQNHRTKIDEVSLELVLGANRLRENYRVYPYVFGGAGLVRAVARTNQLDDFGNEYSYGNIDSNGNASGSEVISQLNNMYDASYETAAEGSRTPRWKIMPSLGAGLGFQVMKGFSIGLEHKVTWALNDVIDGQQWTNANTTTGDNDMYHYSSLWLKFSFGRSGNSSSATSATTNPTDVTTYSNTPQKPTVNFTNPSSSPATVGTSNYAVTAAVNNISSKADISLSINGTPNNGFTYDSYSRTLTFNATLLSGANDFMITATNAAGSATANATVIFNEQPVGSPPPVVKITYPSSSPFTTDQSGITVNGSVMNITSASQMLVSVNGSPTSAFTYNNSSKSFSVSAPLIQGANTFVISATNQGGSDSKSTIVIFSPVASGFTTPAPVVNITSPSISPYTSIANSATVNATVLNVTSQSQTSVLVNGVNTSAYSFNPSSHQLSFTFNLVAGANSVTVSGINAAGNDSKTTVINYNQPQAIPPPVVTIISPAANPFTTMVSPVMITANVQNVTSAGQIAVTVNGGPVPTGLVSFNAASGQISFNGNLVAGANTISVSATNTAGNDSKSQTIIYQQAQQVSPPVVTIT